MRPIIQSRPRYVSISWDAQVSATIDTEAGKIIAAELWADGDPEWAIVSSDAGHTIVADQFYGYPESNRLKPYAGLIKQATRVLWDARWTRDIAPKLIQSLKEDK